MRVLLCIILAAALISVCSAGGTKRLPPRWRDTEHWNRKLENLMGIFKTAKEKAAPEKASKLGCDMCLYVAPRVFDFLHNATAISEAEKKIDEMCAKLPFNLSAKCSEISHEALSFGNWAMNEVWGYNFNLTMILCADMLYLCEVPCCNTTSTPEQVHLSFPGGDVLDSNNMQMIASWVTLTQVNDSVVQWKGPRDPNWRMARATYRTYTVAQWIGAIYGATMTSLKPDTDYTYRVGSPTGGWSQEFVFHTLPMNVGTPGRPLHTVIFADMGFSFHSTNTVARLTSLADRGLLDLIIHTGDLSYADGDQIRWDQFMRKMEPIASRVPYMVGPGNHEALYNFSVYQSRFFMPQPGYGAPDDAMYYEFSTGPVSWLMLDTETWYDTVKMDDVQLQWAIGRLAARSNSKFIIPGFHRPMYCSTDPAGADCSIMAQLLRDRLEGPFVQYGVPLVQVGHVHNYERILPVINNTVVQRNATLAPGPMHLVNGAGGCIEGVQQFPSAGPFAEWSAFRSTDVGVVVANFTQVGTEITMIAQFVRSADNVALDSFTVVHDPQVKLR